MAASTTRRRILVVEDDHDLLRMLQKMLSPVGQIETATDGETALEQVRSGTPPDLIVTDLMMPRMDGLTFARALKQTERTAGIPIVMLTAKNQPLDVVAGINAGARHYVTKPFKQEELLEKVKRALGEK